MAGHSQIMRLLFTLCMIFFLMPYVADNASGSYFKNGFYPQPYSNSIDTFPVLKSYTVPGLIVTARDDGGYIVTSPGRSINVSLMETDPFQSWLLAEAKGAQYLNNSLLDSYPVRHIFQLKAMESSIVRFKLMDERSGNTIKTFQFNLVVDEPASGIGWPRFSEDTVPSFIWPIQQKF